MKLFYILKICNIWIGFLFMRKGSLELCIKLFLFLIVKFIVIEICCIFFFV